MNTSNNYRSQCNTNNEKCYKIIVYRKLKCSDNK